jgi:hypothetical protein
MPAPGSSRRPAKRGQPGASPGKGDGSRQRRPGPPAGRLPRAARRPARAHALPALYARTRNALQRSLRCLGERGFALLTVRWRILQHITGSPSKIGDITRAALVLTHFEYGYIT